MLKAWKRFKSKSRETLSLILVCLLLVCAMPISVVNAEGLTISPVSLPVGTYNTAYSQTLTATGGTTPYTWNIWTGTLPAGLTLGSSTGVISGIPTAVGSFPVTVTVTDSTTSIPLTATASYTLTMTKADPPTPTGLTAIYGQTFADISFPTGWASALDDPSSVKINFIGQSNILANYNPTGDDANNYNSVKNVSVPITVSRATPTASDLTYTAPTNLTYDGSAKTATVSAAKDVTGLGGITVEYYTSTGGKLDSAPTDAGTYTVKASIDDTGTYYSKAADLTDTSWIFTINKADPTYTTPTDLTAIYGQTFADISFPTGWASAVDDPSSVKINFIGQSNILANYTPIDTSNYNSVKSVSVPITASRATPTANDLTYTAPANLTYDGTAKTATVSAAKDVTGLGGITVEYYYGTGDKMGSAPTDVGTYTVKASIDDTGTNYSAATVIVGTLTIAKADPTASLLTYTAPTNLTYDGSEKTATVSATGLGGITVEYYDNTGTNKLNSAPTAAGDYMVKASIDNTNLNYNGKADLTDSSWTFTIKALDLANTTVTLDPGSYTYNGKAWQPTVTVTYNGQTIDSSNYTVSYPSDMVSSGSRIITIAASGNNCTGSQTITKTIQSSSNNFTYQALSSGDGETISIYDPNGYLAAAGAAYFTVDLADTTGLDASLSNDVEHIKPYAFTFYTSNGTEISSLNLAGNVKVYIPISDEIASGWDESDLVVYYINETGEDVKCTSSIVEINGVKYLAFDTNHFSKYAEIDLLTAAEKVALASAEKDTYTASSTLKTSEDMTDVTLMVSIAILSIGVMIVFSKKRKKV